MNSNYDFYADYCMLHIRCFHVMNLSIRVGSASEVSKESQIGGSHWGLSGCNFNVFAGFPGRGPKIHEESQVPKS